MKSVIVKQPGNYEQLKLIDLAVPSPQEGELLVEVHSAAVNRTDIITRSGKGRLPQNSVLGVEVAGVVVQVNGKSAFSIGDRVMGLVNGGGYAEFAVMPSARAIKIPDALSFDEAAAIPEVFLTAYQTLFWLGKLQKNETVLIHAGASGVGTAAIQLAKQLSNATVIVTAGSKRKLDFCRQLGADVLINYKEQSFDKEVLKATDGNGVDLILDFVGADYWSKNLASIKKEGRWVLIGILGGAEIEKVNLMDILTKCIQLTGTLLTPRSDAYKAHLTQEFSEKVLPYIEEKKIRPVIDTVFSLSEVGQAHLYMEHNQNIGKLILHIKD